jgi:NADH-quinone oxidoreductase subunit M
MIIVLLIPTGKDDLAKEKSLNMFRWITAGTTFIQLVISILIVMNFDFHAAGVNNEATMQLVEKHNWISLVGLPIFGNLNIQYFVGIDGISAPMILLTAIVSFLATFASWSIKKAPKGYFAMYLLLVTGMMGVFVALDFFLFYVFWELMLLPMYFLIGIWGGPNKEYAAIKFFLYTLAGSVFMLLVIIALYFATGSFNMFDMMDFSKYATDSILYGMGSNWRLIAFAALFVGFAIKVPTVPFHTWLPDAHVEAPTAISVILAGVLLKMGTYGMLRIAWPMFPDAVYFFQNWIAIIGMVSIVYGALAALGQHKFGKRDFKKLIAYSSVSHMGLVLIGVGIAFGFAVMIAAVILIPAYALLSLPGAIAAAIPGGIAYGITSIFSPGVLPWIIGALAAVPMFFLVVFSPLSFLGGMFAVYNANVWTLTFRQAQALSLPLPAEPPVVPEA